MVLALDLEGTLISNAVSMWPRPGLFEFLEFCRKKFERIVMFTYVDDEYVRKVANILADEGTVPEWFRSIEVVSWPNAKSGRWKDLAFIPNAAPEEILILDDMEDFIMPDHKSRWIAIESFEHKDPPVDRELFRVMEILERLF